VRQAIAIGLVALLGLFAYWIVEVEMWWPISSFPLFLPIMLVIAVVLMAPAWAFGRSKLYLIPPLLFALLVTVLALIDLTPVKPALRALDEIKPGMSRDQALAILESHFPANGRFNHPVVTNRNEDYICFSLDPTDGRYNAALLYIHFEEDSDIVSETEFWPD
jgi:hypothetical protein